MARYLLKFLRGIIVASGNDHVFGWGIRLEENFAEMMNEKASNRDDINKFTNSRH